MAFVITLMAVTITNNDCDFLPARCVGGWVGGGQRTTTCMFLCAAGQAQEFVSR